MTKLFKQSLEAILLSSTLLFCASKQVFNLEELNQNKYKHLDIDENYAVINPLDNKDTINFRIIDSDLMVKKYGFGTLATARNEIIDLSDIADYDILLHEIGHKVGESKIRKLSYKENDFAKTFSMLLNIQTKNKDLQSKINNINNYLSTSVAFEEAKAISYQKFFYEERKNKEKINENIGYYLFSGYNTHRQGELINLYLEYFLGSFKDANEFIRTSSNEVINQFILGLHFQDEQIKFNEYLKEKFSYDLVQNYKENLKKYGYVVDENKSEQQYFNEYVKKAFINVENTILEYTTNDLINDFNYVVKNYSKELDESILKNQEKSLEQKKLLEIINMLSNSQK
jgi:hypothetical protein